jgi:hypothetical protein
MKYKSLPQSELANPSDNSLNEVLFDWEIFLNHLSPIDEIYFSEDTLPWDKDSIIACLLKLWTRAEEGSEKGKLFKQIMILNQFAPSKNQINEKVENIKMHLEMYHTALSSQDIDDFTRHQLEQNIKIINTFIQDFSE